MSSPLPLVFWTIIVAIVFLSLYDLKRYLTYGRAGTISRFMYLKGKENPFFAFVVGFFTGGFIFGLAIHFWGI